MRLLDECRWTARRTFGIERLLRPPAGTAPFPASYTSRGHFKNSYLRQRYHFGPGRIADYLRRFHHLPLHAPPCTAS
jgi:hypothetical protein